MKKLKSLTVGIYFRIICFTISCVHSNVIKADQVSVSQDACLQSKCSTISTCFQIDNGEGYICRCERGWIGQYCDIEDSQYVPDNEIGIDDYNTKIYAVSGTLGSIALLLIGIIIGLCCKKIPKPQPTLTKQKKNAISMLIEEHDCINKNRNKHKSSEVASDRKEDK